MKNYSIFVIVVAVGLFLFYSGGFMNDQSETVSGSEVQKAEVVKEAVAIDTNIGGKSDIVLLIEKPTKAVQISSEISDQSSWLSDVSEQTHPLDVDKAFKHSVYKRGDKIIAEWVIDEQYKLYSDKLSLELVGKETNIKYPKGEKYIDSLGIENVIFKGLVQIEISLDGVTGDSVEVLSKYQGCWDGGVCYPPVERTSNIKIK